MYVYVYVYIYIYICIYICIYIYIHTYIFTCHQSAEVCPKSARVNPNPFLAGVSRCGPAAVVVECWGRGVVPHIFLF